jgi:hypothetical protein
MNSLKGFWLETCAVSARYLRDTNHPLTRPRTHRYEKSSRFGRYDEKHLAYLEDLVAQVKYTTRKFANGPGGNTTRKFANGPGGIQPASSLMGRGGGGYTTRKYANGPGGGGERGALFVSYLFAASPRSMRFDVLMCW